MTNYLLDCVHSEPVAAIDERIASNKLWYERLVEIGLMFEVQF